MLRSPRCSPPAVSSPNCGIRWSSSGPTGSATASPPPPRYRALSSSGSSASCSTSSARWSARSAGKSTRSGSTPASTTAGSPPTRGLAAGEVVEELQFLRELLIRNLAPVLAAMRARQGMAIMLRLNRVIDKGIAVAVVGYTDALVATLFAQNGVPAFATEYDAGEVERQLDAIEQQLHARQAAGALAAEDVVPLDPTSRTFLRPRHRRYPIIPFAVIRHDRDGRAIGAGIGVSRLRESLRRERSAPDSGRSGDETVPACSGSHLVWDDDSGCPWPGLSAGRGDGAVHAAALDDTAGAAWNGGVGCTSRATAAGETSIRRRREARRDRPSCAQISFRADPPRRPAPVCVRRALVRSRPPADGTPRFRSRRPANPRQGTRPCRPLSVRRQG